MDFYNKLNANERMVTIGAVILAVAWLVGVVAGYGFGTSTIGLLGAIAIVVIYYLKYSPTQQVNWPAPIQTLVLIAAGLAALFVLLNVLQFIRFFGGLEWLAAIGSVVGAAMMAWFAWQEYQAMPKTTPPSSNPPGA